jgi:hypothetical protein
MLEIQVYVNSFIRRGLFLILIKSTFFNLSNDVLGTPMLKSFIKASYIISTYLICILEMYVVANLLRAH